MKVLLLGATGNMGSRLIPALITHKHQVVCLSQLAAVVEGDGTDSDAIKAAILKENCDAVVNAAGLAAMTRCHAPSQLPDIFAAVAKAAVAGGKERGGPPLRCWFLSEFNLLDGPKEPYLLADYLPFSPEHRQNYTFIQKYAPKTDLAWSLFCANLLTPRYTPAAYPHPTEASADNLVAAADAPPAWSDTLKYVPVVGTFLNILVNAPGYSTPLEDCADFLAVDLEKGLGSEWVGKRAGLKVKPKAG